LISSPRKSEIGLFDHRDAPAQSTMPIVSYAQNLEDVILQRVLSDVQNGCYVDVGASLPDKDSVTYAFYEKGWRGICIDPLPYAEMWRRVRPQDIFINAAVGEKPGEVTFYVYDKFWQVSTGSSESMEHWKRFNCLPDRNVIVPVLTLNDILEKHLGGRSLHLISIDVEGMEREVLLGLDLGKYRPLVMVVEATIPGTPLPSFDKWESLIVGHGYQAVYFDGLNRFYLSVERMDLRGRFALPPNFWDRYVLASHIAQQEKIAALEATIRQLTK
jgi:FkbM family methyltransferase